MSDIVVVQPPKTTTVVVQTPVVTNQLITAKGPKGEDGQDGDSLVTSVFARQGDIVALADDYTLAQITGLTDAGGGTSFLADDGTYKVVDSSPLTTKGDVFTFDTVNQRLPVGTNGQLLAADSVEATGLKWIDAPSTGIAIGDPITGGTADNVLFVDGSGNLGQDPTLTFDGTSLQITDRFRLSGTYGASVLNGNWLSFESSVASPQGFMRANTSTFQITATGASGDGLFVRPGVAADVFGINTALPDAYLHVLSKSPTTVGAIVQGAVSQTQDLQQWNIDAQSAGMCAKITAAAEFSNDRGGPRNELFGALAGDVLTTGTDNTVMGWDAGPNYETASYMTCVGRSAGSWFSSGGQGNICIGYQAGIDMSSGNTNVIIGYQATCSVGVNKSIVLGQSSKSLSSNQFVAGGQNAAYVINDVYFGNGVTFTAPVSYTINGTGGSGTDIAGGDIAIAGGKGTGDAAGGDVIFQTSDPGVSGTALQALTTKMSVRDNGTIELGDMATFVNALHHAVSIGDSSKPSSNLFITSSSSGDSSGAASGLQLQMSASRVANIWNLEIADMTFGTSTAERMRIDSVGRVAINKTTGLTSTFHVICRETTEVGQIIEGVASQTEDLSQWNPNAIAAGTRARVTADGEFANDLGLSTSLFLGHSFTGTPTGTAWTCVGANQNITGNGSGTVIGSGTINSSFGAVVVGAAARATKNYSVCIGNTANDRNNIGFVAIGQNANNTGTWEAGYGICIGRNTKATGANQFVSGADGYSIAEVYFGDGVFSPTPPVYTINGTGGEGTDIAGADIGIAGGKGTGNAAGGEILFQTSDPGVSGTALQALTTKVTIGSTGIVTIATTAGGEALRLANTSPKIRFEDTTGDGFSYDLGVSYWKEGDFFIRKSSSASQPPDEFMFYIDETRKVKLGANQQNPGAILHIECISTTDVGLIVGGVASQADNLTQWNPNAIAAGTRARVTKDGEFSNNLGRTDAEYFGEDITLAKDNTVAMGHGITANSPHSVLIGRNTSNNDGTGRCVIIGSGAACSGRDVITIGNAAILNGVNNAMLIGTGSALGQVGGDIIFAEINVGYQHMYVGKNKNAAVPVDFTLHAGGGSGTDIAGADLGIAGGAGTGDATPGDILLQTTTPGASGTAVQALATRMRIGPAGEIDIIGLPTSDPVVANRLWNDSGTLKISAG